MMNKKFLINHFLPHGLHLSGFIGQCKTKYNILSRNYLFLLLSAVPPQSLRLDISPETVIEGSPFSVDCESVGGMPVSTFIYGE